MTETNLLSEIQEYIERYVVFPNKGQSLILAAFTIHSWRIEAARTSPILYVHSSTPRAGKTTLLEVMETIVRNPLRCLNVTAPSLFTAMEDLGRPTLLFDEVDTVFSSRNSSQQALRGVINGSYKRGNTVLRTYARKAVKFDIFGCQILAGINTGSTMPETIADRAISITLRRKDEGQGSEPFYSSALEVEHASETILDGIEDFLEVYGDEISAYRMHAVDGFGDRQVEIAHPLLSVVHVFGRRDEMIEAISLAFDTYKRHTVEHDESLDILKAIAEVFTMTDRTKIHTSEILQNLDPSQHKLVPLELSKHNIAPVSIRIGNLVQRGVKLDQLAPVFADKGIELASL